MFFIYWRGIVLTPLLGSYSIFSFENKDSYYYYYYYFLLLLLLLESGMGIISVTAPISRQMHSFSFPSHIYQANFISAPFPLTNCINIPAPLPLLSISAPFPSSSPSCFRFHPFSTTISIPYALPALRRLLRLGPSKVVTALHEQ